MLLSRRSNFANSLQLRVSVRIAGETKHSDMEKDQEFLETVVKALVNHPESVKTDREIDDRGVKITLHVHPEDMGYIIGRQGQTARALRILLKTVGAKDNARVSMVIYEPDEMRRQHQEKKGAEKTNVGSEGLVTQEDLDDLGI